MPLLLLCWVGAVVVDEQAKAGKDPGDIRFTALNRIELRTGRGRSSHAVGAPISDLSTWGVFASPIRVVLGGGYNSDPGLPLSSQSSEDSLKRLVEGICVQRQNPESKLVLSGGKRTQAVANAEIMARVAEMLGVHRKDMVLEADSRDTQDEARLIASIVTTNQFVMVSSASHIPRAMALFEGQNLHPLVVTAYGTAERTLEPAAFFPSGCYLKHAERAVYEYLGLAWTALTARP